MPETNKAVSDAMDKVIDNVMKDDEIPVVTGTNTNNGEELEESNIEFEKEKADVTKEDYNAPVTGASTKDEETESDEEVDESDTDLEDEELEAEEKAKLEAEKNKPQDMDENTVECDIRTEIVSIIKRNNHYRHLRCGRHLKSGFPDDLTGFITEFKAEMYHDIDDLKLVELVAKLTK